MNHSASANGGLPETRNAHLLFGGFILMVALGLFIIRASAPHNFLDKDQERPVSYILDAVHNGNWICQTDWMNDITSKPPMLTWVGALLVLAFRSAYPIVLYVPSALAMTLLALLLFHFGSRKFGIYAGLFAALFFLLAPLSMRLFILLRTDSLFAFFVGASAFAAYRAWTRGSGWTLFWTLAAFATLTKGPLGVLLAGIGLTACLWERSSGSRHGFKGNHITGILIYLLLTMGWFALSYLYYGDALTDKIIRRELVSLAVDTDKGDSFFNRLFKPTIYFVHRMLPWSLFTLIALWRVIRHPSTNESARRFERFLTCWFLGGLLVFSVSQHQRGDLLAPILAPAMLLAGYEASRLFLRLNRIKPFAIAVVVAAIILLQAAWYYHRVEAQNERVRQTQQIRSFAAEIRESFGADIPFAYVDAPFVLQLYLGTMTRNLSVETAAEQLASTESFWVAVSEENARRIISAPQLQERPIQEVARCADGDNSLFVIIGNQPLPVSLRAR